ncbi:TPA: hypothetical protein QDZ42_002086 [Stenotrophomonas maltophilia]|uniref:hypothetical protein n=1 Tax=Stenotrophomonas sp. TaxID=69392 RepID=UPI0028AA57D2|nr:hypothetical protein [Stenotrophomonas sp.]HDS1039070.1 hypothetical protein [Stenotrophomonas maltophilia]HDS1043431.1 hypothetical protein [Stenotrophomonas maltophilia]
MTTPEIPTLHACPAPANADEAPDLTSPPAASAYIDALKQIGRGAAADGQPWPERHQLPGRRLALADADCALAGLRVAQEMLLAAERIRQNGPDEEYVGDRVMEGLMLACMALTAQVSTRMRPEG